MANGVWWLAQTRIIPGNQTNQTDEIDRQTIFELDG